MLIVCLRCEKAWKMQACGASCPSETGQPGAFSWQRSEQCFGLKVTLISGLSKMLAKSTEKSASMPCSMASRKLILRGMNCMSCTIGRRIGPGSRRIGSGEPGGRPPGKVDTCYFSEMADASLDGQGLESTRSIQQWQSTHFVSQFSSAWSRANPSP